VIEFRDARIDAGDGQVLESAMRAEVEALYEGLDMNSHEMPAAGPDQLHPPAGAFLVGYDETGTAVCCGGIKRLADGGCELKRMYVAPPARGRGIARALLAALEARARHMGFTIARLDTGPSQHAARHLYESAGYMGIPNFNGNPVATFFGEKPL
jgi:GNAT superfamily N-acetyltransferase